MTSLRVPEESRINVPVVSSPANDSRVVCCYTMWLVIVFWFFFFCIFCIFCKYIFFTLSKNCKKYTLCIRVAIKLHYTLEIRGLFRVLLYGLCNIYKYIIIYAYLRSLLLLLYYTVYGHLNAIHNSTETNIMYECIYNSI